MLPDPLQRDLWTSWKTFTSSKTKTPSWSFRQSADLTCNWSKPRGKCCSRRLVQQAPCIASSPVFAPRGVTVRLNLEASLPAPHRLNKLILSLWSVFLWAPLTEIQHRIGLGFSLLGHSKYYNKFSGPYMVKAMFHIVTAGFCFIVKQFVIFIWKTALKLLNNPLPRKHIHHCSGKLLL